MNEKYGNGKDDSKNYDAILHNMLRDVKRSIDENRQRIYDEDDSPQVLASLGIHVVHGQAFFHDAKTVNVTNTPNELDGDDDGSTYQLHAKYGIVIATGATPSTTMLQDIAGLDTIPYWTYENVWDELFLSIDKLNPKMEKVKQTKVIVVGGGPIGCELSQAMSRLGCSVVLISKSPRLLPDADVEASMVLQRVLENEGIDVMCNQAVISVTTESSSKESGVGSTIKVSLSSQESILGDHILVATGRVPNINNMGLENIGVQTKDATNGGGICVDSKLQTTVKGIFGAGDCTGDRQFTHYAGFQGAIAARNILLPLKDVGVLSDVPSTTFTDPEVASVGLTEQAAIDQYGESDVSISFRPLAKIDRAICEGVDSNGFIKIVYSRRTKQIVGASIVAPSAGELISEIAVARDAKVPFDKLATVMHSYPSYSIALQQMAAEVYYDKLKKNRVLYDLLKRLGL
jgi:pyruvate/2-oxoglutarate dehydrogenase complex dihydrolipoamide dehydrogenase (E3) component